MADLLPTETDLGLPLVPPFSLKLLAKLVTTANNIVRRKNYTINRRIADLLEIPVPAGMTPVKGVKAKDMVIDESTGVWVRIFTPCPNLKASKLPVVFYYHGGGFAVLKPNFLLYDIFCRLLAKQGNCIVISTHYRRSPEYRFPTAHEDSFSVLKWLQSTKHEYIPENADLSRCFLAGDSAGGNIVHHIGCRAAIEDMNPLQIRGHLLIQPYFGGEKRTDSELRLVNVPIISLESADWHWRAYLPEGEDRDHPICNVFGPRSDDISGLNLPSTLVIVGDHDILQDWQIRYVEGMKKANKDVDLKFYKGAVHAFHIFHTYKLSHQVLDDICNFLNQH